MLCQMVAGSTVQHAETGAVLLVVLFCRHKKFCGKKLFTSGGHLGISRTDKTKLVDEGRIQQGFVSLIQRWSDLLFPDCPLLYVMG